MEIVKFIAQIILLEEYFDVTSFDDNLFTGKRYNNWRDQEVSNSFIYTDMYYEFKGEKIDELTFEEINYNLPDYFYGGQNYGSFEYDNDYYYVVDYRGR
jgi:hypothetical protein